MHSPSICVYPLAWHSEWPVVAASADPAKVSALSITAQVIARSAIDRIFFTAYKVPPLYVSERFVVTRSDRFAVSFDPSQRISNASDDSRNPYFSGSGSVSCLRNSSYRALVVRLSHEQLKGVPLASDDKERAGQYAASRQVGRDGLPVHHHTQQTIYSLVEGLPSYRFRFDTADAEVRIKRGGTPGPIYPIDHGYHAIDIAFPRPLGFGESQYLDYWTNFRYSSAPPQEFRRGAYQRTEHLDMRVEFHREKIPRKIWWAEWSDHLDTSRAIVRHEQLTLDEERSAHRYLDAIQHTVVGFHWEW